MLIKGSSVVFTIMSLVGLSSFFFQKLLRCLRCASWGTELIINSIEQKWHFPCSIIQPTDGVHVCLFNILDESLWKSLNPEAIKSVCGPHISVGYRFIQSWNIWWSSFCFFVWMMKVVWSTSKLSASVHLLVFSRDTKWDHRPYMV